MDPSRLCCTSDPQKLFSSYEEIKIVAIFVVARMVLQRSPWPTPGIGISSSFSIPPVSGLFCGGENTLETQLI
ncbi:T0011547 isoform 3 [Pongo abelii]|uniref:T0011547 isoform 3 n=1 Tax=Pongo abelii TaxID=9601 RepID=A0A2J8XCZ7_PONAB|nr:T0011547 isoform 3 [Pongo abelii]